jgi:hypothetical protein
MTGRERLLVLMPIMVRISGESGKLKRGGVVLEAGKTGDRMGEYNQSLLQDMV